MKKKNNSDIFVLIVIVMVVVFIFVGLFLLYDSGAEDVPSNKGCPQHKTWDEMTSSERKACEKYFEGQFESGEWSLD